MKKKTIPPQIKEQVDETVQRFNQEYIRSPDCYYTAACRGNYLYLHRYSFGREGPICRLKYTGRMDDWEFAIINTVQRGTILTNGFSPVWDLSTELSKAR